jgi:hypothetical protein
MAMRKRTPVQSLNWRTSLFLAAVTLAVLSAAPNAHAGTYSVSTCDLGWSRELQRAPGENGPFANDDCDRPEHGIYADFDALSAGDLAAGDYAGWRFDAPTDTTIVGLLVHWNGHGDPSTADHGAVQVRVDASTTPGGFHVDAFDGTDTLATTDANWVRLSLVCVSVTSYPCRTRRSQAPADVAGHFFVKTSTVTLADRFAPVVQAAGGPAVSDLTWIGLKPITFSATDRGGGIYRVLLEVDGAIVDAVPVASDDHCVDSTGARNFAYPIPCPAQATGTANVFPTGASPGWHNVAAYIEDAAGNRAALMPREPRFIVNDSRALGYYANSAFLNPRFSTPRVLNGNGATSGAKLSAAFVRQVGKPGARHRARRATRDVRFSQRSTVRGTLKAPSGAPISDATVFIGQRPEGQQWRVDGAVHTNSQGAFVYRPAARQSSRRLRAIYFPFSDSHEYANSSALTLNVRAGLTLRVNRHAVHNGDRLIFTGRVLGPVPAAGIAVTLQAKVGRHYRSFRQLRATSRTGGRVRTVYRFERTTRPVRYRFRLKVVRQAGLPFQGGASPVVAVSVRP